MKTKILWALLVLNVALLIAFCCRTKSNSAVAAIRGRADYLMIPCDATGAPNELVYIIDTTNGLLSAIAYDEPNQKVDASPAIDLGNVFGAGGPAAPANTNPNRRPY